MGAVVSEQIADVTLSILRVRRTRVRSDTQKYVWSGSRFRKALARRRSTREAPSFSWISRDMKALVDLSDKEALYAALDAGPR